MVHEGGRRLLIRAGRCRVLALHPCTDGMMLQLKVIDKGPYAAVVTSDGKYVTDDSGKFIVARKRDV